MADEETAVNGVEASADPAPSTDPTSKVIKNKLIWILGRSLWKSKFVICYENNFDELLFIKILNFI